MATAFHPTTALRTFVFGILLSTALVSGSIYGKYRRTTALSSILSAQKDLRLWKLSPPNYDQDDIPVKVKVLIYVTSIDAVSEANMDFTVGIMLHLQWHDKRLMTTTTRSIFQENNWDSIDFDMDTIDKVWIPDIFFPSEKDGHLHNIMAKNRMMMLYRDETLLYISRLTLTLSCPMDLINYPFDKQTCHLNLMSFGFSDAYMTLDWMNTTENKRVDNPQEHPVSLDKDIMLPQFEVKGVSAHLCQKQYHQKQGNHSCLEVDFKLTRSIGFYFVQMYIPSTLIVMLSWISFWLTVNSVPGRISLGLLTVLTMTTQSSSVNASLPRVSYTKAIDVWMSTCLVFVFAALLEFAVVNVLSRKDSIQGFSLKHAFTIPRELENRAGVGGPDNDVNHPLDGMSDEKKGRFTKRGIVYATYLDIAARIFFPTAFILFIIVYWLYYVISVD